MLTNKNKKSNFRGRLTNNYKQGSISNMRLSSKATIIEVFLEYTLFLIGNAFFELSLSVAQLFSKLSLKCC